jgi:cellulose synthase operon protein C
MTSNTVMDMRRSVSLCAGLALVALWAGDARADLHSARTDFLHGEYERAREELKKIEGKERNPARLLLARVELRLGDHRAAEAVVRPLAQISDPAVAADARVLLAEIHRWTGRYQDAAREMEDQAQKLPDHARTRYVLALARRDLGDRKAARAAFQTFIEAEQAGQVDLKDPEALFYVAEAGRYLAHYQYANDTFRDAVHLDEKFLEANLRWGDLFLDKYAAGDAEQSFDAVLKHDPRHPDAHAGMARVKLEQSYDLAAALHHVERALEVNPRHVPALLVRGLVEIDQNQWDKARATLGEVFAVNPNQLEGRALLATIHWLRDDRTKYEAERKRIFSINPGFAELYHIVGRSAVREHRYREAVELEKAAVAIDPEYYEAMQAIGTGYLRLGMEKEGLEWLRRSWKGDDYNVRTDNMLRLFEDIIPKQYSFTSSKNFRWRLHNDEKDLLLRYLVPFLEDAFEDMVRRYGFRPRTPIVIELYRDPEHYSVRTIGLPNLGALGVCFGQVITAMSPSGGDINWAMVLYHELSHVFAIQASNSRVPRWYTEGLSEYETVLARPEWRRENDSDVHAALADGSLPSVAELNYGFMRPNMQQVIVAYHLSSVTIQYIAETYGFQKVVEGLRHFAKGLETPEVIQRITGRSVPEFDAEFRRYLAARLAPYARGFHIPVTGYGDVKKLEIATGARPKDPGAWADLALGHFYDGNAGQAMKAAERALGLDPDSKIALYVKAEIMARSNDMDGARGLYEQLIRAGGDAFEVRARLGMLAARRGDLAEAERQLCTAKSLDPERSYPYQALADLYRKQGRTDEALAELETYVMIEQMQLGPLKRLIEDFAERDDWARVRTYGEMAVRIFPFDTEILLALGSAYLGTGSPDQALFTFEAALKVKPEIRRPALAHIGLARALLAQDQPRRAAQQLTRALEFEPENAEALALRESLGAR